MTQKYILRCFLEDELGDYIHEFEYEFPTYQDSTFLMGRLMNEYHKFQKQNINKEEN